MRPLNALDFIILLCLVPDNFPHQGESHQCVLLSCNVPNFRILLRLIPVDITRQGG
jgi:hypothetical protein